MERQEYNVCMKPYMSGKGFTKEQRQQKMCIGAKICSGKATTEEEAAQICASAPPKEAKSKKGTASCSTQAGNLYNCILERLDFADIETSLQNAVHSCLCNKPPSKKEKEASETKEQIQSKLSIAEEFGL